MKILNAMVGTLLLAAAPIAAQAEDMGYSFLDLGYTETNLDGSGSEGDGFGARGSVGFAEDFFVFADYLNLEIDGVDVETYAVGLGGHLDLSESVDLVGRAGYLSANVSGDGLSANDGYLVSAGVRARPASQFELEGNVIYRDLGGDIDDTAVAVGARYHLTDVFAIGAEYEISDDADTWFAGIRLTF